MARLISPLKGPRKLGGQPFIRDKLHNLSQNQNSVLTNVPGEL